MSKPHLLASFEILGEPVSKSRARFTKRGSKTHAYTPQKTLDGERRVALAFRQASIRLSLNPTDAEIAYRVESEFYNGTRQRRDVDNMTKLVLDGLNGVAWVDDAQVLEIESRKAYVPKAEARTIVRVFEIGRIAQPEANCVRCGKAFRTYDSWASNPNGKKYCSRECVYAHRVERRQRKCQHCGKQFLAWGETRETRFCSVECRFEASRADLTCSVCGTDFRGQKHLARRKTLFCSQTCQEAFHAARALRCNAGHLRAEHEARKANGKRYCLACNREGERDRKARRSA